MSAGLPSAVHQRRRAFADRGVFLGALWAMAALLGLPAACASPGSTVAFGSEPPRVAASPEIKQLEQRMLELVNGDRARAGVPPLVADPRLADVARAHALDMKTHGFFSHDSPQTGTLQDRLDRAGYLALEARENLASAPTIEKAEQNLLASPAHRANLESPTMTHVGIGIVVGDRFGDAGMLTITQVFAKPGQQRSADEVAAAVLEAVAAGRQQRGLAPLKSHPTLQELARRHVAEVPLDLEPSTLTRIGDEVAAALEARRGHGLRAVQIAAQVVFDPTQFDPAGAPLAPQARALGLATETQRDGRGRPQTKVLLLLGQ